MKATFSLRGAFGFSDFAPRKSRRKVRVASYDLRLTLFLFFATSRISYHNFYPLASVWLSLRSPRARYTELMNPFSNSTFTWWQIGIFKVSTIGFGVLLGAYWHEFFGQYLLPILAISLVAGIYISWVYFRQH